MAMKRDGSTSTSLNASLKSMGTSAKVPKTKKKKASSTAKKVAVEKKASKWFS